MVEDMLNMFSHSQFNGDISKWDVRNVSDMSYMFANSQFNGDISQWDVSNVKNLSNMFSYSQFNIDLSGWSTELANISNIFIKCHAPKPWWDIQDHKTRKDILKQRKNLIDLKEGVSKKIEGLKKSDELILNHKVRLKI